MIWLLTALALADGPPVTVEVAVGRTFVVQGDLGTGTTLDAAYAAAATPRLMLEGRAQAQLLSGGSALLRLLPAGRLYLVDPGRKERLRPSLALGAGLSAGGGARGVAALALDVDLPTGWPGFTRLGLTGLAEPNHGVAIGARVALVGGKRSEPPAPDPSPLPVTSPVEPPASPEPGPVGLWWDPRICTWTDQRPPHGWRPGDGLVLPTGTAAPAPDAPAVTATRFGWLVVVGTPSDRVRIAGTEHAIGPDGLARIRTPEGEIVVDVVGGGRTQRFEVAIADGYTLWLRVRPPPEVRVFFGAGSSTVSPQDRVLITELAENRGTYRLRISGSFSPEGDPQANLALADARAAAIAGALRAAGVPSEKIEALPPRPPEPGQTPERQRSVLIQPIPLEAP